jgi:hypothetical protein
MRVPIFALGLLIPPLCEKATRTPVDTSGGVFSHAVGMAVFERRS